MDIRKEIINGKEYMFVNSFRGNRSGFVHETTLLRDGREIGCYKIQYYNRTWERYTYQSVMVGCVRELLDDCREAFERAWRNDHGVKRMTEAKREEMNRDFEADMPKNYVELHELYSRL